LPKSVDRLTPFLKIFGIGPFTWGGRPWRARDVGGPAARAAGPAAGTARHRRAAAHQRRKVRRFKIGTDTAGW